MDIRNPSLYNALERAFGTVHVSSDGDNYYVNCPFCPDQRHRLSFHHTWGTYGPNDRYPNLGLVNCFNEHCMSTPGRRQELFDLVFPLTGPGRRRRRTTVNKAKTSREPANPFRTITELPEGDYIPVHQLKPHDEARLYLEGRGFDCDELWEQRRVLYCSVSPDSTPNINDRLVIPFFGLPHPWDLSADKSLLRLIGYIARRPSEDQPYHEGLTKQKYIFPTGFQKSTHLYGVEHVSGGSGPVVIVEGVTDVWRLKRNAVALNGKTMSKHQEPLIVNCYANRPLIVFLDADAQTEAQVIAARLVEDRRAAGETKAPVFCLSPPKGMKDVAECSLDTLRELIEKATGLKLGEEPTPNMPGVESWKYPATVEQHLKVALCTEPSIPPAPRGSPKKRRRVR